jgi:hypothetical protein
MIQAQDEGLHPIGAETHWQESWYFNWADLRYRTLGVARIGFRFHQNEIDALVFTLRDGKPEFAYPAVNVAPERPWEDYKPETGIRVRDLNFLMIEPHKRWRLTLEGRNSFDLEWEAFTPAFDYAASTGEGPPEISNEHFEQSGRVRGRTRFKGRTLEIDGYGQRDKSWGVRDWDNIVGWTWISVQFGEDFSFNSWQAPRPLGPAPRFGKRKVDSDNPYFGGFVFYQGQNHAIENLHTKLHWGKRKYEPVGVTMEIHAGGHKFSVEGRSFGVFPMAKNGLWIYESYTEFTASINGKHLNAGVGVIEHTFHVGRAGYLLRAPEIAGTLRSVFLGI